MPLIATRGAASAQGFGEFAQSAAPVYIEDAFSTWLYTGNSSTQTITNGIDLSTKGGMVWTKNRSSTQGNAVFDTVRGNTKYLLTQTTDADQTSTDDITGFLSTGYTLGNNATTGNTNYNNYTYVSWTFREQPKFFDVVTWTGNGDNYRTISHNLKSTPGCVIVKSTSASGAWAVWHRSVDPNNLILNSTSAAISGQYSIQDVTSANFAVANSSFYGFPQSIPVNNNGATYVAYLFAHNAGGFGLTGADNVISCGSYTTNGSGNATVNLGYEPQWILWKRSDSTSDWYIFDTMRGWTGDPNNSSAGLRPNLSNAENSLSGYAINSTGFSVAAAASATYIYIAIRRGPMKTPTTGTSVFKPVLTATASETVNTVSFTPDMQLIKQTGNAVGTNAVDRLRGVSTRYQFNAGQFLLTNSTNAESSNFSTQYWNNTGFSTPFDTSGISTIYWTFSRAPGFFDVVCYTGTGSATTFSHNLGVVPEMMIVKRRSAADNWFVYSQTLGNTKHIALDGSSGASGSSSAYWNNTSPTASVFSVGNDSAVNASASTYVNYLFASCPGVSKVGSYTGTGTTLQIDCGFTGGARWVMIKRTDSTGDWYVWDSARGIVAGNDPYLLLNSTAAEVTNTDYVDTYSAGFEISSTAPAAINANGGTFIFLAVA